jgi:hypothetical protein
MDGRLNQKLDECIPALTNLVIRFFSKFGCVGKKRLKNPMHQVQKYQGLWEKLDQKITPFLFVWVVHSCLVLYSVRHTN